MWSAASIITNSSKFSHINFILFQLTRNYSGSLLNPAPCLRWLYWCTNSFKEGHQVTLHLSSNQELQPTKPAALLPAALLTSPNICLLYSSIPNIKNDLPADICSAPSWMSFRNRHKILIEPSLLCLWFMFSHKAYCSKRFRIWLADIEHYKNILEFECMCQSYENS